MNLLKDPNKRKWVIVATMFIAIICNYLDRQLLSILKPEILEHFGIGDMQYAWIVNVFLICYALMYPVSGILVDRFGPKRVMLAGIAVWSLACIGGGLAQTVWQFAVCRGILGLAEPTIFAGQLVAVTLWFEKRQRATANSLCTVGGSLGAVIAPLVIAWLMRWFSNWQEVFLVAGVAGLVIAGLWMVVYRTPSQEILDRTVNVDRMTSSGEEQKSFTLGGLFRTRTLWGAFLIRLISDPVRYFCCFWLPGYLRGMGEAQNLTHEQTQHDPVDRRHPVPRRCAGRNPHLGLVGFDDKAGSQRTVGAQGHADGGGRRRTALCGGALCRRQRDALVRMACGAGRGDFQPRSGDVPQLALYAAGRAGRDLPDQECGQRDGHLLRCGRTGQRGVQPVRRVDPVRSVVYALRDYGYAPHHRGRRVVEDGASRVAGDEINE